MRIPFNSARVALLEPQARYTLLFGAALGAVCATFGLLTVISGPLLAFGALFGVAIGLYALTNLTFGLYLMIAIIALLPFGTLPVRFALTPTFIDVALGAFLLVYLFEWMTRRRESFRFVPAQLLIVLFIGWCIFSFVAGLGHALLTTNVLRKFVEMLLSMATAIVIVDVARDRQVIARIAFALSIFGAVQALIGVLLYALNDQTTLILLNALGRLGYPRGDVLRYIEDNPLLGERAIGTWVDPNAYGGFLLMFGTVALANALNPSPAIGRRTLAWLIFAPYPLAMLLTQSRGAWLAFGAAIFFMAVLRYRWLLIIGAVSLAVLLSLPFMQRYVERFIDGLQGQDLATQMRFGEYKDSLTLIGRYPLIGVGFAGTPDRDIYLGVSSTYLKIANSTGLIGVTLFGLILLETLRYGLAQRRQLRESGLEALWLGFAAALFGVAINGVVDHYYFNLEFHAVSLAFWLIVGLALAATRATRRHASQTSML
ncbi:MAG: O-antigen ligase family protein [Anaerolineae bacterium]|nr:O-antigen ligase family protein [Anaerolineae bacterium]MDW8298924.1 O-antigen ligase family protein [Anaerolineae bacterium]